MTQFQLTSVVTVPCDSVRCKHTISIPVDAATAADQKAMANVIKKTLVVEGWGEMTLATSGGTVIKTQCPKCLSYTQRRFEAKTPTTTPTTPPADPATDAKK